MQFGGFFFLSKKKKKQERVFFTAGLLDEWPFGVLLFFLVCVDGRKDNAETPE